MGFSDPEHMEFFDSKAKLDKKEMVEKKENCLKSQVILMFETDNI